MKKYLIAFLLLMGNILYAQDLTPTWDNAPTTANPGQTIYVDLLVHNLDATSAGSSKLKYYISPHNYVDGHAFYLGYDLVSGVGGNDAEDESASLIIPSTLTCGNYYLLAVADADNQIAETVEYNNLKEFSIAICPKDLEVSWSSSPASANAGDQIYVDVLVTNSGSVSTGASCRLEYFISSSSVYSNLANYLDYDVVSSIPAYDSEDETATLTIPSGLMPGTYYLIAYVDIDEEIQETEEYNNWKAVPIQVLGDVACEVRDNESYSWDWTQQEYATYTFNYGAQMIKSPWFSTYNNNENINEFRIQNPKDFENKDGWELIQVDLGIPSAPVNHPYFILYNRYSGILRIFVAIGQVYEGYSDAVITLAFTNGSKRSALLENHTSDRFRNALDNFDNKVGEIEMANQYAGDHPNFWLHADFVMNYDPCTCRELSQLTFTVGLIDRSSLNFELNGNAVPVSAINSAGRFNGLGSLGLINQINGAVDAGTAAQRNVTEAQALIETIIKPLVANNASSTTSTVNAIASLSNFAGIFSQFTTSTVLMEFLAAALTNGDPASSKPMFYDISLTANGTITSTDIGMQKIVDVPGSDNLTLVPPTIIEYNNTLGVFNLNKTPRINTTHLSFRNLHDAYKIRLAEDLQYAINPASGFDASKSDIKAAFIIEYVGPSSGLIGVNPNELHYISQQFDHYDMWGTPYYRSYYSSNFYPIGCLGEYTLTLNTGVDFPITVHLKVAANLKTGGSNEALYVSTYEAEMIQNSHPYASGYWTNGEPFTCGRFVYPSNPIGVCNSIKYQNLVDGIEGGNQNKAPTEVTAITSPEEQIRLYPNPNTGSFVLEFHADNSMEADIELLNVSGEVLGVPKISSHEVQNGLHRYRLDTGELPPGVYLVRITASGAAFYKKMILLE